MRKACYHQYISRGNGQHAYAHDAGLDSNQVTCRARPEVHIWYCSPSRAATRNASTLTMRYVRCGAGVSTVSLLTHRILLALGDEDLPAARQSGPSLRILRDWALLAAACCFSCRQGCQARPSGAGARQEACAVCQGASDAPTGKVRRRTWAQMGPTWHFKSFSRQPVGAGSSRSEQHLASVALLTGGSRAEAPREQLSLSLLPGTPVIIYRLRRRHSYL